MRDLPLRCSRQSFQRPASLQLAACLYGACPGSFLPFFGVRRTRFGFGDAFGFVAVVAGLRLQVPARVLRLVWQASFSCAWVSSWGHRWDLG